MEHIEFDGKLFFQHPVYTDYYASSDGEIYSTNRNRLMNFNLDKQGYLKVGPRKDGKQKITSVHRFVYECFHGIIPDQMQIDHINHVKTDNRIENLRLVNRSENCRNRAKHNTFQYEYVEELPPETIKIEKYRDMDIDNLYYCPETNQFFWYICKNNYRVAPIYQKKKSIRYGDTQLYISIILKSLEDN